MIRKIFLLLQIVVCTFSVSAQNVLRFNEIMQSNIDCLFFEHEYPDSWVELYNNSDEDIDLFHYYISKTQSLENAYRFDSHETILANSYKLVYCDKTAAAYHTDFRLESTDGGSLFLADTTGIIIDQLNYPSMVAPNISYGRLTEDNIWGWEASPTPGKTNCNKHLEFLLPTPDFSFPSKIMTEPEYLTISIPNGNYPEDTRIYYTINGKEPTVDSNSDTIIHLELNSNTIIRAKLISSEALSPRSTTHSYIFHPRETVLPIFSIVTNNTDLYGSKEGIFSSTKTDGTANYYYNWRRPMNIEYLGSDEDTHHINQIGEMGVAGDRTRSHSHKSMKFYANKRFGVKRFYGVFWKEKPHVDELKSFTLRNGGQNDGMAMINDGVVQKIFGTHVPTLDYLAYEPVIAYINGNYKGLYGLRERSNEDYVEANYKNIKNIETASEKSYYPSNDERYQTSFYKLYDLYRDSKSTYSQIAELMDVNSFMQAMIVEIFTQNYDFPQKNVAMWREKSDTGKWHWILKDLDHFAMTSDTRIDFNMFKYLLGTAKSGDYEYSFTKQNYYTQSIKIYQKMMSLNEFKQTFIDTYATYLGDFLKPSVTGPIYQKIKDDIDAEVEPTFEEYGYDYEDYDYYTNRLKTHCMQRASIIYDQMAAYFNLGSVIPMTLRPNKSDVTINDIRLTEGDFDGAYFSKRNLRLNSNAKNIGWAMTTFSRNTDNELVQASDTLFPTSSITILLSNYNQCDSVAFATYTIANNEFELKLQDLDINRDSCNNWSDEISFAIEEPQYGYVNISCDSLPATKYSDLHAQIDFYDNQGNYINKKILLNKQGDSETKSNFSITFCEDEWIGDQKTEIAFGNWVQQSEFHLKGFYEDGLRGTAEIAYQLYGQIAQKDNGYPKAFPISLYINGDFYGIMAWQTKKHRDIMGLEKNTPSNVWIDGTINDKQLFRDTINWTKFEIRNPKNLFYMDGTEYDGDYPNEPIDETSPAYTESKKMKRCSEAKRHIVELSHYYSELKNKEKDNASAEEMRLAIKEKFNVPELINYMIFSLVTNNYDGFSKNWQWFTFDGKQWTVAPYDCNLTFGYNEEGSELWPATQSSKKYDYRMENADTNGPMIWIRRYFWDDLKSKYAELRNDGTISVDNIISLSQDWTERIGTDNYNEEWLHWKDSPIQFDNNESLERLEEWITERIELNDIYLGYTEKIFNYELTLGENKWATLCVPFSFDGMNDIEIYSITGIDEDTVLILNLEDKVLANKPYLIYGKENTSKTVSGILNIGSNSEVDYLKNGLLIGTLTDTYAPINSFVLQTLNNKTAFYHVPMDYYIPISAYHAYLQTQNFNSLSYLRIREDQSALNTINDDNNVNIIIFDILGQKNNILKPGFNIISNSKSEKSKIFVK